MLYCIWGSCANEVDKTWMSGNCPSGQLCFCRAILYVIVFCPKFDINLIATHVNKILVYIAEVGSWVFAELPCILLQVLIKFWFIICSSLRVVRPSGSFEQVVQFLYILVWCTIEVWYTFCNCVNEILVSNCNECHYTHVLFQCTNFGWRSVCCRVVFPILKLYTDCF